jgi:hypothetical protein
VIEGRLQLGLVKYAMLLWFCVQVNQFIWRLDYAGEMLA